ncbi:MAG TPA: helix-turn-helix transcriptional regulator [Polyangia bacterium]|jgi:transcriptional regulator with XRE-family HTH domain|nr:helix-turn-helix transcriptional regulator [Polyangia bacterium]
MPSMTFSASVRGRLKARGMTQADLARAMGATRQWVGQIVNGKRAPSAAAAERIAKALGVPLSHFPPLKPEAAGKRARAPAIDVVSAGAFRGSKLHRMPAIDITALDLGLFAGREAVHHLLQQKIARLLQPGVGKPDTLALDSESESIISSNLSRLSETTRILTEERRDGHLGGPVGSLCFFVDPVDRSSAVASALRRAADQEGPTRDVYSVLPRIRERMRGALGSPFLGITFVRDLIPRFSLLANYLSNEVVVACAAYTKICSLDRAFDAASLERHGEDLAFAPRDGLSAVFFPGHGEHAQNRKRLAEALDLEQHPVVAQMPGGPARVLALADIERESLDSPSDVAVVASVGEKITEFIHWIGFAMFSQALAVYELSPDGAFAQDRLLLAPSERYSIFNRRSDRQLMLDEHTLAKFGSGYRGCIAVTHVESRSANARFRSLPFARELLPGR